MQSRQIAELQDSLSAKIHDMWFNVDDLKVDARRELLIELRLKPKDQKPHSVLTIHTVKQVEIHDTEKIGTYDLNRLVIDAKAPAIVLYGNIPIVVRIEVEDPFAIDVLEVPGVR